MSFAAWRWLKHEEFTFAIPAKVTAGSDGNIAQTRGTKTMSEIQKRQMVWDTSPPSQYDDAPAQIIGMIVQNDEFWDLTADQLRDAILNHRAGRSKPISIVRFLNGEYCLFDRVRNNLTAELHGVLEVREEIDGEWDAAWEKAAGWREAASRK
jgi:hypothetical protein